MVIREDIRTIVKEEIGILRKEFKEEITASETRLKDYVDVKFEGVNGMLMVIVGFVSAMIVLIVVTVGIPQVIMAWRGKETREQDERIKELSEEIEALKRRQIIGP